MAIICSYLYLSRDAGDVYDDIGEGMHSKNGCFGNGKLEHTY